MTFSRVGLVLSRMLGPWCFGGARLFREGPCRLGRRPAPALGCVRAVWRSAIAPWCLSTRSPDRRSRRPAAQRARPVPARRRTQRDARTPTRSRHARLQRYHPSSAAGSPPTRVLSKSSKKATTQLSRRRFGRRRGGYRGGWVAVAYPPQQPTGDQHDPADDGECQPVVDERDQRRAKRRRHGCCADDRHVRGR